VILFGSRLERLKGGCSCNSAVGRRDGGQRVTAVPGYGAGGNPAVRRRGAKAEPARSGDLAHPAQARLMPRRASQIAYAIHLLQIREIRG